MSGVFGRLGTSWTNFSFVTILHFLSRTRLLFLLLSPCACPKFTEQSSVALIKLYSRYNYSPFHRYQAISFASGEIGRIELKKRVKTSNWEKKQKKKKKKERLGDSLRFYGCQSEDCKKNASFFTLRLININPV